MKPKQTTGRLDDNQMRGRWLTPRGQRFSILRRDRVQIPVVVFLLLLSLIGCKKTIKRAKTDRELKTVEHALGHELADGKTMLEVYGDRYIELKFENWEWVLGSGGGSALLAWFLTWLGLKKKKPQPANSSAISSEKA